MKKFLSLVLALVMTMSLVTISAGAKTFEDDAAIEYSEAVEVMKAVGVIDGYADGSFNPTATLTRGAAAKIICNMILGPTNAGALSVTAAPFKDVPANNVFAGYIAYCSSEGIINGYTDGTFRPAATLTGYAFMKMLLGALGYDATIEGYTGNNFAVNVAKRALNIGLDDGLINDFNGTKPVTRQEACLYAFNTLKAPMVKYPNSSTVTIGDIQISTSAKAEEIKDDSAKANLKVVGDDTVLEFAEKYFSKLKCASTEDDYGRPAHKWTFSGDSVGTYVDDAVLTYTTAVKGYVMNDDLDDADCGIADNLSVRVNGYKFDADTAATSFKTELSSKSDVTYTGKGVQFELYDTNEDDKVDTIVVIYTVLGKITDIVEDKASTKSIDERAVTVETDASAFGTIIASVDGSVKAAGLKDIYDDLKVDDYVLVTPKATNYSNTSSFTWGAGNFFYSSAAVDIAVPETVKGVMTYRNTANDSVKIDGTTYSMAYRFDADTVCAVSDKSVVAYADAYGNLLMVDGVSATKDKSVAVLDYYKTLDKNGKMVDMVKGVTSNGEIVNWEVKAGASAASVGAVYTYTEDASRYTLTPVETTLSAYTANSDSATFEFGTTYAGETYQVNDDARFALATSSKKICTYADDNDTSAQAYNYFADTVKFIFVNAAKGTATVKEGPQKVAADVDRVVVFNDDAEVSTVYVLSAPVNSIATSDALIFLAKETGVVSVYDKAAEKYVTRYAYDAYVNGEKVEDFYADASGSAGGFYKNEVDTDTGAYVLSGNRFTGDSDFSMVTGTLDDDDDSWYKSSKLIVVGSTDLGISSKTVFADNTAHEVTSLSALKNLVMTEENDVVVTALYDTDTADALYVYVTTVTAD